MGCFLNFAQVSGTREFRDLGLGWSGVLTTCAAVLVVPSAAVLGMILVRLHRCNRLPRWLGPWSLITMGLAGLLLGWIHGVREGAPGALLHRKTGIDGRALTNLNVSGFDSFLARRWLFSFEITSADASKLVSRLNLELLPTSDPSKILTEDLFLRRLTTVIPKAAKVYASREMRGQAVSSVHFAMDEQGQRGWILVSYQN